MELRRHGPGGLVPNGGNRLPLEAWSLVGHKLGKPPSVRGIENQAIHRLAHNGTIASPNLGKRPTQNPE